MTVNKLLKTKYPVFQGGMAHIATGAFAAAVSEAGALGVIGAGGIKLDKLRQEILLAKSLTDKPFGVNLLLLHPEIEEQAKLVEELGVEVVTTGAGNPGRFVESWKEKGIKVFPVVAEPALAIRMARLGVDGLIAEGSEAGGHIGTMTTMTLIPQVLDRVDLPVIAAGGIATGEQLLAVEVLGASGVQMGTLFLATEECPIHQNYKDKIINSNYANSKVIGRSVNMPLRLLNNPMVREYLAMEKLGKDKDELEHYTLGALRKAVHDGNLDEGSFMAGLVVSQIHDILPVKERLEQLFTEYDNLRKRFIHENSES